MKVQLMVGLDDDQENTEWSDFYINPDEIKAFFPTHLSEKEHDASLNIYFMGFVLTIKSEPHFLEYLSKRKDLIG